MKKILHVIGFLGRGGDTSAVINVMEHIIKKNLDYEFEFLTHRGYNVEFVEKLQKRGIKVHVLEGDVRKLGAIKYFFEINKIYRRNKYDAVHFHTSFQSAVGLFAAKINGVKIRVCHSHTSKIQRKTNIIGTYVYIPLCRILINLFANRKIACSKIAGDFLFGEKNKYSIVYNGINIDDIRNVNKNEVDNIRKKYKIRENDILVGQVGVFNDNKNQLFTIQLAEKLNNKNYKFFLIGDGENFEDIKSYIVSNKISNVFLTGRINNVKDFMYLFNYLLLPSKYGEGLPVTLTEQQIIKPNCLCIASSIVTRESNIGSVEFLDVNDIDLWLNMLRSNKNDNCDTEYDVSVFDINNTVIKWLSQYE